MLTKKLSNLKIDDLDKNHLVKIELFYKNYPFKSTHTEFEDILYDFIKKYKEVGAQRYFNIVGSYKTKNTRFLKQFITNANILFKMITKNFLT